MSRGPKKWTEKEIRRRERAGYGKGTGSNYKSWIGPQDFSSVGFSYRGYSSKLGRYVELLSHVEWNMFLLLEWLSDIVEIYEQWPLDRSLTQAIAAELGIRHPFYPGTHVPVVMTVDFMIVRLKNGIRTFEGFDCKRADDIDARVLEKLEITHRYLEGMGFAHHLVTDKTLPDQICANLQAIRSAMIKPGEIEPYKGFFNEQKHLMLNDLQTAAPFKSLSEYCADYDAQHAMRAGTALRIAKLLLADRLLIADMAHPNLMTASINEFQLSRSAKRKSGAL